MQIARDNKLTDITCDGSRYAELAWARYKVTTTCVICTGLPGLTRDNLACGVCFRPGRVFGHREEGGDHFIRVISFQTGALLNRILSAGALCDIRYSPSGACDAAHFFHTDRRTTDPANRINIVGE